MLAVKALLLLMAFSVVQEIVQSSSDSNTTSLSVTLPTTRVVNDLQLVSFTNDGGSSRSIAGSDWAILANINGAGATNLSATVWWRLLNSGTTGDTASLVTIGATQSCAAQAVRITGQHLTTDPEANTPLTIASDQTPDLASLDPAGWGAEDTIWIGFYWAKRGQTTPPVTTYPANYIDNQDSLATGTSNGMTIAMCSRDLNAASDDPGVLTWAFTRQTTGVLTAIRPAGAPALFLPFYPRREKIITRL